MMFADFDGIEGILFDFGGTISGPKVDHLLGEKPVDPEAAATMRTLRRMGKRVGLVSNTLPGELRWPPLAAAGVADVVEGAALSYPLGFGKPDQRIYLIGALIVGCELSQTMWVGDRLDFDVARPLELGAGAAALVCPDGRPDEDLPERAILIKHVSELPARLGGPKLAPS
jgi:FMN phosphatase YigB (HAD superfamily)